MNEQFTPTEEQIASVIEKTGGDPRKLAVAYLRAQKRARDSETALRAHIRLDEAMAAALDGDTDGAAKGVERATAVLRGYAEQNEATATSRIGGEE